jgi:hypothetical protein
VEATTKGKGIVAPPIVVTEGVVAAVVAPPADATKRTQIAKAVVAPPTNATAQKDDVPLTHSSRAKVEMVQQPPAEFTKGKDGVVVLSSASKATNERAVADSIAKISYTTDRKAVAAAIGKVSGATEEIEVAADSIMKVSNATDGKAIAAAIGKDSDAADGKEVAAAIEKAAASSFEASAGTVGKETLAAESIAKVSEATEGKAVSSRFHYESFQCY